jgi:MATE family multidrug resistance protein|tara:strand:+ start:2918 stop:4234 length:1317 start_codon:yes stop_codon:yes gene_type:complete
MNHSANVSKSYLFKLSIPIFFSNIAIPFVGIVDTGLMGHLGSEKFLAAISIATSIITMIFWSFGFLRMATVGLISQSLGKKDWNEIALVFVRNLILAIFFGFFLILLKNPILFLVEHFFKTSQDTQLLINQYISIRIFSAPAELILYVLTGLYLGLKKTKIASIGISVFCIGNIILSSIFVIYFNLEIFGVALGTVISAYITVIVFLLFSYYQLKNKFSSKVTTTKIFNTKKMLKLFSINFDIFIRTIFLTFSFLWFTYQSSKLGENYLAVNTILLQFVMLSSFFLDAYAFSTEAVIGYTIGKKSEKSFLEAVRNSFQLSIFSGLVISLIYFFSFQFIVNLLTDLDYLQYLAFNYFFWIVIIPPIASLCYQFDGIFIGASQTAEMRNAMVLSVIIFITTSYFLVNNFGNHGLWISLLLFMIIRSITLNYYFNRILKNF